MSNKTGRRVKCREIYRDGITEHSMQRLSGMDGGYARYAWRRQWRGSHGGKVTGVWKDERGTESEGQATRDICPDNTNELISLTNSLVL